MYLFLNTIMTCYDNIPWLPQSCGNLPPDGAGVSCFLANLTLAADYCDVDADADVDVDVDVDVDGLSA